ncbi:MAG: HDOD domain-containing protein [Pseudomonadales bacterium]
MANPIELIQAELESAIAKDELALPTLPEVALKIRDTAQKDDISPKALAGVVSEDPALTARFMRIANSPIFRGIREIDDLQHAISRIGIEYAANLAAGLAIEHMFQATSDLVDRKLRQVWSHACEVAAICGVLAKSYTRLRPDQATLAGLIHTIGVLPILSFAEDNPRLIRDSFALEQIIENLHGRLGTRILESWDFPDDLAMVPGHYTDFDRNVAEADFVDLVMVSHLQTISADHPHAAVAWSDVPAFRNIGLDTDLESAEMEAYHEDVATAKVMLA